MYEASRAKLDTLDKMGNERAVRRLVKRSGLAILATIGLLTAACLGGGGGRRPQVTPQPGTSPGLDVLRGSWTLVGLDAQGPKRASGRLTFDESNTISIRAELAPDEPAAFPPRVVVLDFVARVVAASRGELTYVGLRTRAPREELVPLATEPDAWHHFSIQGDTLEVWQEDGSGRRVGTLTFTRGG
jgi:hypothetical protein